MIGDRDEQLSEPDPNSWSEAEAESVRVSAPDQTALRRQGRPAKKRPVEVQVATVAGWFSLAAATVGAVSAFSSATLGLLAPTEQPVAPPPPVINCVEHQRAALELQTEFPDREYWQTGIVQDQCRINQLLNGGQATPP